MKSLILCRAGPESKAAFGSGRSWALIPIQSNTTPSQGFPFTFQVLQIEIITIFQADVPTTRLFRGRSTTQIITWPFINQEDVFNLDPPFGWSYTRMFHDASTFRRKVFSTFFVEKYFFNRNKTIEKFNNLSRYVPTCLSPNLLNVSISRTGSKGTICCSRMAFRRPRLRSLR